MKAETAQPLLSSETKDDSENLAQRAKRNCTDVFCLFFIIIFFLGLCVLAYLGAINGDPHRLLYGTDYTGSICGREMPEGAIVPSNSPELIHNMTVEEWSKRNLLWYPIVFDITTGELNLREAMKQGICVSSCPEIGDIVVAYKTIGNVSTLPRYPVFYSSRPSIHRCLPFSFHCENVSECVDSASKTMSAWLGSDAMSDVTLAFQELASRWWVIAACTGITIVLAFAWLLLLRRCVKPYTIIMMALIVLLPMAFGGFSVYRYLMIKKDFWIAMTIAFFLAGFIIICVLIFFGKSIMIACDVIEEAVRVPFDIPTVQLVPIIIGLLIIGASAVSIVLALYIQSSGAMAEVSLRAPFYNEDYDLSNITNMAIDANASYPLEFKAINYKLHNWRTWAHIYNLFAFLWAVSFYGAIAYMVIALCAVFWYWSVPGNTKRPPRGSLCLAFFIVFRYHLGTLAFASFFIAIIRLLRVMLLLFEKRLKSAASQGGTRAAKTAGLLTRCLHCCLVCLERIIRFANNTAFCVCAINGKSFIPAAREGVELVGGQLTVVAAMNFISAIVFTLSKIIVSLLSVGCAFLLVEKVGNPVSSGAEFLILVIVLVVSFLLAALFFNVVSVCLDAILMCFCYDIKYTAIDYFPDDLAKHLDKCGSIKKSKDGQVEMKSNV